MTDTACCFRSPPTQSYASEGVSQHFNSTNHFCAHSRTWIVVLIAQPIAAAASSATGRLLAQPSSPNNAADQGLQLPANCTGIARTTADCSSTSGHLQTALVVVRPATANRKLYLTAGATCVAAEPRLATVGVWTGRDYDRIRV